MHWQILDTKPLCLLLKLVTSHCHCVLCGSVIRAIVQLM
jgi:hypothetical protein